MPDRDPERKRARERERRKRFTPAQRAAAAADQRLYAQHRRQTDEVYLNRVREHTRQQHARHAATIKERVRQKRQAVRLQCLRAYSPGGRPTCACCGEGIWEFLTLDHLADRRSGQRRVGGTLEGTRLFEWLIRMGFPPGFQVLCFNCNCGRSLHGGACPHGRYYRAVV